MKVTIDVDCTPEEARRMVGLPDLTPLHDRYLAMMGEALEGKANPEMVEAMLRSWTPLSDARLQMWRRLFDGTAPADR